MRVYIFYIFALVALQVYLESMCGFFSQSKCTTDESRRDIGRSHVLKRKIIREYRKYPNKGAPWFLRGPLTKTLITYYYFIPPIIKSSYTSYLGMT